MNAILWKDYIGDGVDEAIERPNSAPIVVVLDALFDDVRESFVAILNGLGGVFSCNIEKHRACIVGSDFAVQCVVQSIV